MYYEKILLKAKLLVLFVTIYFVQVNAQSNCNRYWSYQIERNEKVGLIGIPNPNFSKLTLKAYFSVNTKLNSNYVGEIDLAKNKQNAISDIEKGLPILYRIRFPVQDPLPKVTAIYINDRLICKSAKGKSATSFFLDYTFVIPQSLVNQRPVNKFAELNAVCGAPDYGSTVTGLIIGGQTANPGQFPWLAAYSDNGAFLCGCSLVSTRLVLTAAHCVQNKGDTERRKAETALITLGRNNLVSNVENNYVISRVSQLIVHPQWNPRDTRFDADLALAVLSKPIRFTKFIKPICLWTATPSYNDLVGKAGIVVGWGRTTSSAISTDTPKWTVVPVVSDTTCVRSNNAFGQVTSPRTFCGGDRKGKGPCTGDSGGGFVVNYGNKWYLRGIISSALLDTQKLICDVTNFAVFTDTSKFSSWVYEHIQQYG